MTPAQLVAYLGPALIFALLISATVRLLRGRGGPGSGAGYLTLALALFFLALTQHPFPDPARLECSQGGAAPILRPFATLDHLRRLWAWTLNEPSIFPGKWLGNQLIQAAVMNFCLCAAIGGAFAGFLSGRPRGGRAVPAFVRAGLLATGLSLGAELTQLTAFWGLYPCPYRQFEVDDLILNISGFMTGFALLWHGLRHRRGGA